MSIHDIIIIISTTVNAIILIDASKNPHVLNKLSNKCPASPKFHPAKAWTYNNGDTGGTFLCQSSIMAATTVMLLPTQHFD